MSAPDRIARLKDQAEFTGIDFIRVVEPTVQTTLYVYFIVDPNDLSPPLTAIDPTTISITSVSGGERLATVPVVASFITLADDRHVLQVDVAEPGDFSLYRLFIDDPRIDRFFNGVEFSFKQGCPTGLDCEARPPDCPPDEVVDFPVDYLARDFESFRRALFDFARQRYPGWADSLEADVGVMLLELMSALGDELSYIQDQYARESHFSTATQRHSVRRHARLIDYELHDGRLASTFLAFQVGADVAPEDFTTELVAGSQVSTVDVDSVRVVFELGSGLADQLVDPLEEPDRKRKFAVQKRWNSIKAHVFDASMTCLPVGSSEVWLEDPAGAFTANPDVWKLKKKVILESIPTDPSLPRRAHLVTVEAVVETTTDPLIDHMPIVLIRWSRDEATPFEFDLETLHVLANVVPATAGQTFCEYFSIGKSLDPFRVDEVVEREGPLNDDTRLRTVAYRFGLKGTEDAGLGFLGDDLRDTKPEIHLQEVDILDVNDECTVPDTGQVWDFFRRILDAGPEKPAFSIEDGMWRRVVGFQRDGTEFVHVDYAGNAGYTIRFGDGEFGRLPEKPSLFQARYRTGPGAAANLSDNVLIELKHPDGTSDFNLTEVRSVRNPLAVTDGVDPESLDEAKRLAPEAYRAVTFRAVRPEDYRAAAEELDFVQRANATFRWTGSWLSAFVTVDPEGSFELTEDQRQRLEAQLDCRRQAGKDVIVRDPRFVNLDLELHVCVEPFAYGAQVKERVLEALFGKRGPRPVKGFFDPDNFTFGTPLLRSNLEAAIQNVQGVRAVLGPILIRSRNVGGFTEFFQGAFTVADNEVIRVANDPQFPERGTIELVVEGGA